MAACPVAPPRNAPPEQKAVLRKNGSNSTDSGLEENGSKSSSLWDVVAPLNRQSSLV
jgi:hypothetical protein